MLYVDSLLFITGLDDIYEIFTIFAGKQYCEYDNDITKRLLFVYYVLEDKISLGSFSRIFRKIKCFYKNIHW